MRFKRTCEYSTLVALLISGFFLSCTLPPLPSDGPANPVAATPVVPPTIPPVIPPAGTTIAGAAVATESVLRAIPVEYVDAARKTLHIAYQHTSHGTHVAFGLFGLPGYKAGDDTRFGITNNAASANPDKLDFHDYAISSPIDLSNGVDDLDGNGDPGFVTGTRLYLDNAANQDVNVVMWSWCSMNNHSVQNYLDGMAKLIAEYGVGGTKVGSGAGKRAVAVTFIFMTGHAQDGDNVGALKPKDQADLINAFCREHGYFCIDYYSIDTHDMAGAYHPASNDDGHDLNSSTDFYGDWQASHALGVDWFENLSSPGGSVSYGEHNDQHITANRKAYAMWFVLARIAGWNGSVP